MERFDLDLDLTQRTPSGWERMPGVRDTIRFKFCRKSLDIESAPFRQFWMERASLYPDRGRAVDAHNFRPILDFFWCAYCWTGQQNDPVVQETLVLASLLPHARSIGARRVLRDAVLRGKDADANEHLADLEAMLRQGRTTEIDTRTFHEQIADALDVRRFSDEERALYEEMTSEFFAQAKSELRHFGPDALVEPLRQWSAWERSIGRRAGKEREKLILDMLSYECRAALHFCYSTVWDQLIPALQQQFALSPAEVYFHGFWHRELVSRNDASDPGLFFGQVLGLHPGSGSFMATQTGQELMVDAMTRMDDTAAFKRMLHGLAVAIIHYGSAASTKRPSAREKPMNDADDSPRRRGRHRRPKSDEEE